MRPPVPVPLSWLTSSLFSSTIFRAVGVMRASDEARAAGAGAAAGVGADALAAPPASVVPRTSPTRTLSPSLKAMVAMAPVAGAGTSMVTLWVSRTTSGSSAATVSPCFLFHFPTTASVMDSPRGGTFSSTAILGSSEDGFLHDELLLEVVRLDESGGGARRLRASDVAHLHGGLAARGDQVVQAREDVVPGARVAGLLLDPEELGELGHLAHQGRQLLEGEGEELLHAHDGDGVVLLLVPRLDQVVVDLARAQEQPRHALGVHLVQDDLLEAAGGELVELAHRLGAAQQALGRHDDEGLAQRAQHLAAPQVEGLRGRGGVDDLEVVLGAQAQEALQTGAGVLGALALVAVGQEQGEAAEPPPLALTGGDELVDDDLRAVGEVTELGLPEGEAVRHVQAVAVLEAEHAHLRQRAVVDVEAGLALGELVERRVLLARLHVVEHGVAVAERAALAVLAAQADRVALGDERGVGERLALAPLDLLRLEHGLALLEHRALHDGVHVEALGRVGQLLQGVAQLLLVHPGLHLGDGRLGAALVGLPQALERVGLLELALRASPGERRVELLHAVLLEGVGLLGRDAPLVRELLGVERAHRVVLVDDVVHDRLGERGVIALVVAEAAVADE